MTSTRGDRADDRSAGRAVEASSPQPANSPFGTPSLAAWSCAIHTCGRPDSPPQCPACADDHDDNEQLIHGPGGWESEP